MTSKAVRYGWKNDEGTKGRLQWIKVSDIKVDPEIQRQISEVTVLAIARDFDWSQFGAIDVSKRGDGYYVFDGQHRYRAAVKRGIMVIPCVVHEFKGDYRREEAMALVERNTNVRRVDAVSKHRLRVIAEEATACKVQAMLDDMGLVVGSHQANGIRFIALVVSTFSKSPEGCRHALRLQRLAIGESEQPNERIHRGMFYLCERLGHDCLEPHMTRVYNAGGKTTLMHAVNRQLAMAGASGVDTRMCAIGILAVVNHKLKANRLFLGE
jgi:hypothetical protein